MKHGDYLYYTKNEAIFYLMLYSEKKGEEMGKFYEDLQKATDEVSEVQPLYRSAIVYELSHSDYYEYEEKDKWGRPLKRPLLEDGSIVMVGNTDGKIKGKYLDTSLSYSEATYIEFFILLECKLNQSFRDDKTLASVLLQIICYLKQMQDSGDVLPKAIVVGSKVNCFTIGVNVLAKYVVRDIQGYKSASTAYKYNSSLMQELLEDKAIQEQLMIYDITPTFDMHDIVDRVAKIARGTNLKLSLDTRSVAKAFDYFSMYVLKDSSKIDPRLQQKWFLQLILNADDNDFILDKDKAYIGGKKVNIDGRAFRSFQTSYKVTEPYTSEEERQITATADRLIEDCDRRRKGDFYTPTVWVDEAHKMLTEQLGADWREKYIVWDCACGTKNLTRDYGFKELYSSTLIEGDLALSSKYNVSGTPRNELGCAFQYDFLNDDVEEFEEIACKCKLEDRKPTVNEFKGTKLWNVARGLIESLCEGKPLLFFINPPYGTANNREVIHNKGDSRNNMALTKINKIMNRVKIGKCSQQLYAQFIYRCMMITDLFGVEFNLGLYSTFAVKDSPTFSGLRGALVEREIKNYASMMFCAADFADCSDQWGVLFSCWTSNESKQDTMDVSIRKIDKGNVIETAIKKMWNLDNKESCAEWMKYKGKVEKLMEYPQLSSALIIKSAKICRGTQIKGSLGYLVNIGNKVEDSNCDVYWLTACGLPWPRLAHGS